MGAVFHTRNNVSPCGPWIEIAPPLKSSVPGFWLVMWWKGASLLRLIQAFRESEKHFQGGDGKGGLSQS